MSEVENCTSPLPTQPYVTPGMPTLDMSGRQTSFFEFWPTYIIYLPVVIQSLLLAIRYRSLTLPLIANPNLPLSGMVGVEKSLLFSQARGQCRQRILPWFVYQCEDTPVERRAARIMKEMQAHHLTFPVVCKPDIGCRGSGVKLVGDREKLQDVLSHYTEGSGVMVQALASWEPEVGVFYVRLPGEPSGKIISMALKYSPYVVGDGKSSLRELIENDTRAGQLQHLYFARHATKLTQILAPGEVFKLVFAASHCRGAIFRDACNQITPALTIKIDALMKDIPGFNYGRLDIKFKDIESLKRGENFEIVEINSASSEPLHIWDRKASLFNSINALLSQYRKLYAIGAENRRLGYKPPALRALLAAWKKERTLSQLHPLTD